MASVTLTEVWLHDAADPSDYIASDGFGPGGPDDEIPGEVRTYAGGRRRVIKRAGRRRSYSRTFPAASQELIDWLDDHMGETVMVRDPKSRRFWAVYFAVPVDDRAGGAPPDVTISLQAVSWDETA